jgi:hypothetical protein
MLRRAVHEPPHNIRISDFHSIGGARLASVRAMKLYAGDDRELMDISKIVREGNALLLKGKIFGSMPVTPKLTPAEVRAALQLLDWRTLIFVICMVFRRR